MRRPRFFVTEGGGGVQAQRRENSFDFFKFVLGVFSPNFPRMRGGVQLFTRGVLGNANFYRI